MATCSSSGGSKGKSAGGASRAMTSGASSTVVASRASSTGGDKVSASEARDLFDSPVGTRIAVKGDDGKTMYTLEKTGEREWTKDGRTTMTSAAPFGSNLVGKSVTISKKAPKASKTDITTTKSKSGAKIVTVGPKGKLTPTQVKRMAAGTTINYADWKYVKLNSGKWRVFKNGKRQADRSTDDIIYVVAT